MSEIGDYLMTQYYSKYHGPRNDVVPTIEQLEQGITNHPDKFVIVRDDKIKGVAIFVTLCDETYAILQRIKIGDIEILKRLLREHGPNVHFILLCADGRKTILRGIDYVKRKVNPKTISWWNPDFTKLHKYTVRD